MNWKTFSAGLIFLTMALPARSMKGPAPRGPVQTIRSGNILIQALADGTYALQGTDTTEVILHSTVGADLMGTEIDSSMYPTHTASVSSFQDEPGQGKMIVIKNTGLAGKPDLICELRLYDNLPWGDLRATLVNSTQGVLQVHSIRVVQSVAGAGLNLNGPDAEDRVLSDSFSEDSPQLKLMDLGEPADGMHRGFGSQLIYNRRSRQSLFLGALSADRLLTVFHLKSSGRAEDAHVASYEVEATGTQEGQPDRFADYPAKNNIPLKVRIAPGESLSSERVMFAIGTDYHQQLENYGQAIRILNKARVTIPTPIGWWSWTALYYGVTEANVLTNAQWLAQNLKAIGYRYFQVDEGYQYARGEYATPDGRSFPRGVEYVGDRVRNLGLTFGVWVAPFQVSERSWVYLHHPEWLVHTEDGEPVHIGKVGGRFDELYSLDTTNPGAQDYLRYTYRTLVKEWGVRFIKMDFMDSSAVEGVFYRPNTTALQAQRIGLEVIRKTVGDDVILDKDGSPMLTPVGIVDAGRTSQDTGHTFESTRDAASGVAARYYMNRNFYVTDPDAFTVSTQIVPDRGWHGNKVPLTMEEAESSIALSAISGGMFEIGDDLPTLGASPERVALVRNPDLLDMARLGKASIPLDLMTYLPEDKQPSLFLLKESDRQQILTIFNWTEESRTHTLSLHDLGLAQNDTYTAEDVFGGKSVALDHGSITMTQPPHSVRMVKLVDESWKEGSLEFLMEASTTAQAGDPVEMTASAGQGKEPLLRYVWNFGDGVSLEGTKVAHAYTQAGHYKITVTGFGLSGRHSGQTKEITVTGFIPTIYDPSTKERLQSPK